MPKLKTHRGAKKRFRVTASGKVKRGHSHAGHILTKKTTKIFGKSSNKFLRFIFFQKKTTKYIGKSSNKFLEKNEKILENLQINFFCEKKSQKHIF